MGRWPSASFLLCPVTSIFRSRLSLHPKIRLLLPPPHPCTFSPSFLALRRFAATPSCVPVSAKDSGASSGLGAIKEKPLLDADIQGGPDYLVLKTLDADNIRIIGSVLDQSIALDYFVSQVDGMVQEFVGINCAVEKTGKLSQWIGQSSLNLLGRLIQI